MSFAETFGDWLTDAVTVEPYLGAGFGGEVFGVPVVVEGILVEEQRRLVLASEGKEVLSETTLYVPAELADRFALDYRVILPDGRRARVVRVASPEVYGVFDFRVVNLT